MAKKTRFIVTTPLAVASFPHLDKPDLFVGKGKKAEDAKPKYKTRLVFVEETDFAKIEEKSLEAIRHEWGEKIKPAVVKSCIKSGDAINEDRANNGKDKIENIAGKMLIDASSIFQPDVVDAKKRPIAAKTVRGGDEIKAILELVPCEPSGKKTIGVRLLAVQLVNKRASDGSGWSSAFDEEEGYEGDGEGGDEKSEGDTSGAEGSGSDSGDF